ncbi:MAG: GHKL domain-containing protein [Clostridiales bacterium]|jgi:hypothetical protein|nr:GHKL domain-containing protein [Clostridiales bacterium]
MLLNIEIAVKIFMILSSFAGSFLLLFTGAKRLLSLKGGSFTVKSPLAFSVAGMLLGNLWILWIIISSSKSLPPVPCFLLSALAPVLAVAFHFAAANVFRAGKVKSVAIAMHTYVFCTLASNVNHLGGSLFTFKVGDNSFFNDLFQELAWIAVLSASYCIASLLIRKKGAGAIFDSVGSKGRISFITHAFALYLLMVLAPVSIKNELSAGLALFSMTLLSFVDLLLTWRLIDESRNLRKSERQIEAMKTSIEDFNGLKHDFYNILGTYSGFLETGNLDRLKKYHESVSNAAVNCGSSLDLSGKMDLNPALIALLIRKSNYAKSQNVKLQFQLLGDIGGLGMSDMDCCRMLSCLLDNAIEEAAVSKRKSASFTLSNNGEESKIITITNSTKDPVDLDAIKKLGSSGKEGHMGVGVNNSLKIADSYENCKMAFSYFDYEFTSKLEIRNVEKFDISSFQGVV